jgi:hypothetical protein
MILEHATNVLDACDCEHRMSVWLRPTLLVYRAICSDDNVLYWPEENIGNLRLAMNARVSLFRM